MKSYGQVRVKLSLTSLFIRLLLVGFVVFGTFNPSSYTITGWLLAGGSDIGLRLFVGFSLVCVWIVILRISMSGIGLLGAFFGACALLVFFILGIRFGFLQNLSTYEVLVLCQFGVVIWLTLGLVLSFFIRQFSGQSPVVKNPP